MTQPPELLRALGPVLEALRRLGVRHYVGGSIASSAHGVARSSLDADVVAELRPEHAAGLIAALSEAYYVPEDRRPPALFAGGHDPRQARMVSARRGGVRAPVG